MSHKNRTHGHMIGHKSSATYASWKTMKQRCLNPNHTAYKDYGGAGITVCERWHTFANFLADMGPRPNGKTLDREDGTKGYEPGNCRWATRKTQSRNKKDNVIIEHDNKRLCIGEWSEVTGIKYVTLMKRYRAGWDAKRILTQPVKLV